MVDDKYRFQNIILLVKLITSQLYIRLQSINKNQIGSCIRIQQTRIEVYYTVLICAHSHLLLLQLAARFLCYIYKGISTFYML